MSGTIAMETDWERGEQATVTRVTSPRGKEQHFHLCVPRVLGPEPQLALSKYFWTKEAVVTLPQFLCGSSSSVGPQFPHVRSEEGTWIRSTVLNFLGGRVMGPFRL